LLNNSNNINNSNTGSNPSNSMNGSFSPNSNNNTNSNSIISSNPNGINTSNSNSNNNTNINGQIPTIRRSSARRHSEPPQLLPDLEPSMALPPFRDLLPPSLEPLSLKEKGKLPPTFTSEKVRRSSGPKPPLYKPANSNSLLNTTLNNLNNSTSMHCEHYNNNNNKNSNNSINDDHHFTPQLQYNAIPPMFQNINLQDNNDIDSKHKMSIDNLLM